MNVLGRPVLDVEVIHSSIMPHSVWVIPIPEQCRPQRPVKLYVANGKCYQDFSEAKRLRREGKRHGLAASPATRAPQSPTTRDEARPSDSGGLHAAQFVFQVLDLVADPGGYLELQLGSGGVHLLAELLDQSDQVHARLTAAHRRGPGGGTRPGGQPGDGCLAAALLTPAAADELRGVRVLADQLIQDVGDPLAQRRGVDPVLDVVGDLLVPAA